MPFTGSQFQVTATPNVILIAAGPHAEVIILRNAGATNSVFLGDSTVTASGPNAGYELVPGANTPMMQLVPEEAIYAVCAAGLSTRVDVIQSYSA